MIMGSSLKTIDLHVNQAQVHLQSGIEHSISIFSNLEWNCCFVCSQFEFVVNKEHVKESRRRNQEIIEFDNLIF